MKSLRSLIIALMLLAQSTLCVALDAPPKVVVSITPFYALVAAVMQGVGTPTLLVKPGVSPHDYVLRPSEMKRLHTADVIFWAGPELETFLIKPLHNLPATQPHTIVAFATAPKLLLLPVRQTEHFDPHHHCGDTHATIDMHFWLDPQNALVLTDVILQALTAVDPAHAAIYGQNAKRLKTQLQALDQKISEKLKSVSGVPYIVFHDAYQYMEHRYGLKGVGAICLHPEVPPSAKRLKHIRDIIQKTHARCVFTEPQFQPKLVDSLSQDLTIKTGELDPIGQATDSHPEGYSQLLERLADSLEQCLRSDEREDTSTPKTQPKP